MNKRNKICLVMACILSLTGILAGCGESSENNSNNNSSSVPVNEPEAKVKLSLIVDNTPDTVNIAKALTDAFMAKNPNITIETEIRPGGVEGNNLIKTRMATGDMNDILFYNSGAFLQALNPEKNLLDLTNEPFQDNVVESFKTVVSTNSKIYGVPYSNSIGGGWFYNKKVYADLGLSVPKTWAELKSNNEKIKAAGITPIIGTFKNSWTSQLIVLADYYNVQAEAPTFAEDFTANKAKFATTPSALRSFQKLEEMAGSYNKDYLATTYDAGLRMLAEGKGAHYPMLSFAIPVIVQNNPKEIDNIGFFAQPGDSPDKNGLTVWMPGAAYIYKNTKYPEQAKKFLAFIASVEGMAEVAKASVPSGPYMIKGAAIPNNVPQVVKDMLPYFEKKGATAPALEFVSPVKGPNLEQLTVEISVGKRSAKDAAALYDKDVEKQAQQLGLKGW